MWIQYSSDFDVSLKDILSHYWFQAIHLLLTLFAVMLLRWLSLNIIAVVSSNVDNQTSENQFYTDHENSEEFNYWSAQTLNGLNYKPVMKVLTFIPNSTQSYSTFSREKFLHAHKLHKTQVSNSIQRIQPTY